MYHKEYNTVANVTEDGNKITVRLESHPDYKIETHLKKRVIPLANVVNHVEEMLSRY